MRLTQSSVCFALMFTVVSGVFQAAHADDRLAQQDIDHAIELAKDQFRAQYGNWMLDRSSVEFSLNDKGDEAEIRIRYQWGGEKVARYSCGYEIPGRLCCDRAFSGPGAI